MTRINDAVLALMARFEARKGEEGQGMAEYGLILALVAVVAAVALEAMGPAINDKLGEVNTKLGG